jgi:long-chain acyl-CoA synthetase
LKKRKINKIPTVIIDNYRLITMYIKPSRYVFDSLLTTAQLLPDKMAIAVGAKEFTYRDLYHAATCLANALHARGLSRGDRVAIYMDNTWECVVSIYAVSMAGGVFLVINPQTKSDKLEYIVKDSGAEILLSDAHLGEQLLLAVALMEKLQHVICSGSRDSLIKLNKSVNRKIELFIDVLETSTRSNTNNNIIPNDLAALIYTSGSTGNPKGVMQTHLSMTFVLGSLVEYLRLSKEHVILNVLPFAFDYGLYQLLMSVHLGATLVLERSFTYPAVVFKRIEEYGITVFPGVPTIYSMIISAHRRKPLLFPSITRVTNTAAALPEGYVTALKEVFPNALIYKMYGLTECKRVCYLEPELLELKPASVGKAIPGTETYLLTQEGKKAKPGEHGVLHVRGPHIMLGYWKQPELSAHMLKEGNLPGERILCTHDWFYCDDEGLLYFVGRSDDIIKTRGEKVSPIEIENILHGIEGVNEAAVIGVPDDMLGESIRAYVSLHKGYNYTEKDIRGICISRLENFMVPKDIIILDELPKTATGKISKKRL